MSDHHDPVTARFRAFVFLYLDLGLGRNFRIIMQEYPSQGEEHKAFIPYQTI